MYNILDNVWYMINSSTHVSNDLVTPHSFSYLEFILDNLIGNKYMGKMYILSQLLRVTC